MESTRLLIRRSNYRDCELFAAWEQQAYLIEAFTINQGRDYEAVLREFFKREEATDKAQFTIVEKTKQQPIGRIYLAKIDPECAALEINRIYIGEAACLGKGYGEEAMCCLLAYCFNELQMERVYLDHFMDNQRAGKLYLKLGFQYEGVLRHATRKNGAYYDLHLMSMLREEYCQLFPENASGK